MVIIRNNVDKNIFPLNNNEEYYLDKLGQDNGSNTEEDNEEPEYNPDEGIEGYQNYDKVDFDFLFLTTFII